MSRCGCSSSAASGVSILDTDTVNVSGAGTPESPFTLDAEVSEDDGNLLEARPDGLFVPPAFDDFLTYTPEWSVVSGTDPTPFSIEGRYLEIGPALWFYITVTAAGGGNFGSGTYTFSLPSGYTPPSTPVACFLQANGESIPAQARVHNGVVEVYSVDNDAEAYALQRLSSSFPVTWTSMLLEISGTVPAS